MDHIWLTHGGVPGGCRGVGYASTVRLCLRAQCDPDAHTGWTTNMETWRSALRCYDIPCKPHPQGTTNRHTPAWSLICACKPFSFPSSFPTRCSGVSPSRGYHPCVVEDWAPPSSPQPYNQWSTEWRTSWLFV